MSETTQCPWCNKHQTFHARQRDVDDGMIEIFLRCRNCKYEIVSYRSTKKIEKARADITKLRQRVAKQPSLERVLDQRVRSLEQAIIDAGLVGQIPMPVKMDT